MFCSRLDLRSWQDYALFAGLCPWFSDVCCYWQECALLAEVLCRTQKRGSALEEMCVCSWNIIGWSVYM